MAFNHIPQDAFEIQTGLWAVVNYYTFKGQTRMRYNIYSADGYCFWEVRQPENYDEEGNLLPLEQRVYAQYMKTIYSTIEELNENFRSIPVQEAYEIVSTISIE